MPRSKPASAASRSAAVWPAETSTPRAVSSSTSVERAGQLGRERDVHDRPCLEQPPQLGEVGRAQVLGRVRAAALG